MKAESPASRAKVRKAWPAHRELSAALGARLWTLSSQLFTSLMAFFDSFRTARWVRTLNLVLQAVLFLTLFVGLNYLARNHAWRYDLTQHRRYLALARDPLLPEQLKRAGAHRRRRSPTKSTRPTVHGLLNEYVHATRHSPPGKNHRRIPRCLPEPRPGRAARHRPADTSSCCICGDRRRTLVLDELYRVEKGVRDAFHGEQAFTAAILDVSSPGEKKIYFLTGHGELNPDDRRSGARALAAARRAARAQFRRRPPRARRQPQSSRRRRAAHRRGAAGSLHPGRAGVTPPIPRRRGRPHDHPAASPPSRRSASTTCCSTGACSWTTTSSTTPARTT